MTVRRQPLDQALDQIRTLTERLHHTHPDLTADLNRIEHTTTQLAHWLPRAQAITNRGDGLCSPSLQPHRSSGGHADPVAALVEADWGDTGRTKRGHAGKLDQAADHIRTAHHDLSRAQRADDQDAADIIRDARHGLDRALSLVQGTMPKSYDRRKLRLENPPACTNCLTHGHHTEAGPGMRGLCRWCYDTARAIGRNPDAELVCAHHQNRRVTRALMDRLDREAERRRTRQRAKRKAGRR